MPAAWRGLEAWRGLLQRTDRTVLVTVTRVAYAAAAGGGRRSADTVAVLAGVALGAGFVASRLSAWPGGRWAGVLQFVRSVVALVLAQAVVNALTARFPMDTPGGLVAATALLACASSVSPRVLAQARFLWLQRVFATVKYIYSSAVGQNGQLEALTTPGLVAASVAFATGAHVWEKRLHMRYVLGALSMVGVDAAIDGLLGNRAAAGAVLVRGALVVLCVLLLDAAAGGRASDNSVVGELRGFAAFRAGQQLRVLLRETGGPDALVSVGVRGDALPTLAALLGTLVLEAARWPRAAVLADIALSASMFLLGDVLTAGMAAVPVGERVAMAAAALLATHVLLEAGARDAEAK